MLRPVSSADHGAILAFIAEYYAYDEIPFDEPSIARGLRALLSGPELGRAFFIRAGERDAGYLILTFGFDLEFGGRTATITDLYLRPEFRRQGLGAQAVAELCDLAASWGVGAIELQPERDNTEALAFYAKAGFAALDRIPMVRRLTDRMR